MAESKAKPTTNIRYTSRLTQQVCVVKRAVFEFALRMGRGDTRSFYNPHVHLETLLYHLPSRVQLSQDPNDLVWPTPTDELGTLEEFWQRVEANMRALTTWTSADYI